MSNFSGAIGRGIGSREHDISSNSTQKKNYELSSVPFSDDLRILQRPTLLNSSSEESVLSQNVKREVFVQDQGQRSQLRVNSQPKLKAKYHPDQRKQQDSYSNEYDS